MNDYLISLFIDNELDLGEKINFVECVASDNQFTRETLDLLEQEQLLTDVPDTEELSKVRGPFRLWISAIVKEHWSQGLGAAAVVAVIVLLLSLYPEIITRTYQKELREEYRFVLYSPGESQLNIMGTFTDWKPLPMQRIGSSGYWQLILHIPQGEHRYSYLVGDGTMMADPTITARESDDFGGENSIILVGGNDDPIT